MGALAPPDGLEPAEDFSLDFSSAEEPPEGVASLDSPAPLELPPLVGSSVASLPPDSLVALSVLVVLLLALVVEVEVEVVWPTAFSALVSFGGVMSGVLLGTESEALLPPPQAPSVAPEHNSAIARISARSFN